MVVGDEKFGGVSYVIVGGSRGISPQKMFVFFYTPVTAFCAFLKQIFGYAALHYAVDRLNLQLNN
jgi:hypothetical protein